MSYRKNDSASPSKTPALDAAYDAEVARSRWAVDRVRNARQRIVVGTLAALGLVFAVGGEVVSGTGCGASAAQIQKTEEDGFKLAGCILSLVFQGTTDPAQIGAACVGALPAVIIDVIDDFAAQRGDASAAATLSPEYREKLALLDEAKKKATAVLAAKATSK